MGSNLYACTVRLFCSGFWSAQEGKKDKSSGSRSGNDVILRELLVNINCLMYHRAEYSLLHDRMAIISLVRLRITVSRNLFIATVSRNLFIAQATHSMPNLCFYNC
jgi:hypothetical protein